MSATRRGPWSAFELVELKAMIDAGKTIPDIARVIDRAGSDQEQSDATWLVRLPVPLVQRATASESSVTSGPPLRAGG